MTIEDRAQEILKVGEKYSSSEYKNVYKNAYIKGATDQRKIDIDKACEWLDVTLSNIVNTIKEVPDVFPCIEPMHREDFIINFRKAMEE